MSEENSRARPGIYTLEDEGIMFYATLGTDPLIVRRHISKNGVLNHIIVYISRLKNISFFVYT